MSLNAAVSTKHVDPLGSESAKYEPSSQEITEMGRFLHHRIAERERFQDPEIVKGVGKYHYEYLVISTWVRSTPIKS